ncbi:hypothetical protein F2Q68_00003293 [Brassica cretica]|uniref:Senescence domain-containing protein n=1 Tax=Brassica cretica TaxID=69181 RepID=A0A8S9JC13_BRACR|nr:hypothetical protein F2Q68_00003293 [Brassica cretica]
MKEEVLLKIPGCIVHLVNASEPLELASGEFKLVKVSANDYVTLAMLVRVGLDLQWPVVKEEPMVKVNAHEYLFTLPDKDGDSLGYKVTFSGEEGDILKNIELLEELMREDSCFSYVSKTKNEINWKEFSPNAEEYKSVVAKAIAEGSGHIIKGIFSCSNSFSKKVVETLWKASETIGATVLDGEDMISGLMMAPVLKSKLGKALLSTAPGEILLASLDSFAAEMQTHSATSMAASKLVSKSFGEKAGKTTGKVLETTGSLGRSAWKIQKAMDPSYYMISKIAKNAPRE